MSFIEEHFDTEVAFLITVFGAFWGLLRHNDTQHKEHLKDWLERLEKNMVEIRDEMKEISENLVLPAHILKMDSEIESLQKEIILAREKTVSIERIKRMDLDFQSLREMIQKIKEIVLQLVTKEKEDLRHTEESLMRLEKKIDSKLDERTCNVLREKK
jgi:hypothetical protein